MQIEDIFQEVLQDNHVRENLIALKEKLRRDGGKEALDTLVAQKGNPFVELICHEDAKVRRNAALILGELEYGQCMEQLAAAYQKEQTLFVRADYLKAMQKLEYSAYLPMLRQRYSQMTAEEIPMESRKHYREEIRQLQRMLMTGSEKQHRVFSGTDRCFDIVLTTNRRHREVTAGQIREYPVTLIPLGVRAADARPGKLFKIRTFREMLFALNVKAIGPDPLAGARTLAESDLLQVLERGLGKLERCYFRITVVGAMTLEQRSSFSKRCGFELEQQTGRRMMNAPEGYEAELRLYQRRDGTFLPLLKFSGLPDSRFAYRRKTVSTSMHPSNAALMAALARPYLKEHAQVLDPFCGVGTMLIERNLAVPAGTMYGVDLFGDAISGARENSKAAGHKIYFVQRDFMEFSHEYQFDEIFTDMPARGKRTREEQDKLYAGFFAKASELLAPGGIIIMYSNERGYIRKQLRLREEFRLFQEYSIQQKGDYSVFIIGKKK